MKLKFLLLQSNAARSMMVRALKRVETVKTVFTMNEQTESQMSTTTCKFKSISQQNVADGSKIGE